MYIVQTHVINECLFSNCGRYLISTGEDNVVSLWDVRRLKDEPVQLQQITVGHHSVLSRDVDDGHYYGAAAAINQQGMLLTAANDGQAKLWDINISTTMKEVTYSMMHSMYGM